MERSWQPAQEHLHEQYIAEKEHRPIGIQGMLEELRVLAQPGAMIALIVVLLLMAAGDAAIVIATKGWPF